MVLAPLSDCFGQVFCEKVHMIKFFPALPCNGKCLLSEASAVIRII